MKGRRLHTPNVLKTPDSGTTFLIDYSEKRRILEVEFTSRQVYQYKKVEPEVWKEYRDVVLSGGSSGNFVNTRIKPYYPDFKKL